VPAALSSLSLKWRLASLVEILLTLGFVTDALTAMILAPVPPLANPLDSVRSLAAFTLLSSLLMVLLITLLLRLRGESLASLCLGGSALSWRDVGLGIGLVPGIFLVSFVAKSLIRHWAGSLYSGERNVLEDLMRTPADLGLFVGVALIAGGLREEMQRAFIIRRFEAAWGPAWLGSLLFALVFGYGHLLQGKDEAIIAGLLGLIWGGLYVIRRNIVANSISHALYDATELVRYFRFGPLRYW
jgi:membrane protease YdiL (CAAX protease family)